MHRFCTWNTYQHMARRRLHNFSIRECCLSSRTSSRGYLKIFLKTHVCSPFFCALQHSFFFRGWLISSQIAKDSPRVQIRTAPTRSGNSGGFARNVEPVCSTGAVELHLTFSMLACKLLLYHRTSHRYGFQLNWFATVDASLAKTAGSSGGPFVRMGSIDVYRFGLAGVPYVRLSSLG